MTTQSKTINELTTTIAMVPFNQLIQDFDNVRKTRSTNGIDALADNIHAEGLLQNLVVRKVKGGKYAVSGGERRRCALGVLIKRKHMKPSDLVPCRVIKNEATSASLSENIHREAMHPADQFEAWAKLHDEGLSASQIAQNHGVTPRIVEQRLKLGRLSPVILEALRADKINIDAAMAYTITDDPARQETVFNALHGWGRKDVRAIKNALTEEETPSTNKLALFIGREAYEAQGGTIRNDLFDEVFYYRDAELLTRLVSEKLQQEAKILENKGWAWIECAFDHDYAAGSKMRRIHTIEIALSKKDQAEKTKLETRLVEIENDTNNDDEISYEHDEVIAKLELLEDKATSYKPKERAIAGGFLSLGYDGTLSTQLGYIRAEDDPKLAAANNKAAKDKANKPRQLPQTLRHDLAAIRLEILQAELLKKPLIARDLLAFETICSALSHNEYYASPFELTANRAKGKKSISSKGDMGRFEGRADFEKRVNDLPLAWMEVKDKSESFKAFHTLSEDEKTRLQAYAAITILNPQLSDEAEAKQSLECAASMIGFDCATHWTPDERFFERLTKPSLLELLKKLVSPSFAQSREKYKKSTLAQTLSNVFDPETTQVGINEAARKRLAAWVPDCMTVKELPPLDSIEDIAS